MWRKLDLSHNVLDALGTAGFLFVLDTEEYRIQAQEFRGAARALRRAAQEENTEAGALAYMHLTFRCIRCHRSLGVLPR